MVVYPFLWGRELIEVFVRMELRGVLELEGVVGRMQVVLGRGAVVRGLVLYRVWIVGEVEGSKDEVERKKIEL